VADVNVLVVFYSRHGRTEKLALAAGVGAIQARADIRLRRLADRADRRTIEADPAWRDALERMQADYVEPRPQDYAWADLVVLAAPSDASAGMLEYIAALGAARASATLEGKLAAPMASGDVRPAIDALRDACGAAGLAVASDASPATADVAAAREYGRRVVESVRLRKHGTPR
jgi:hypothetical protein